MRPTKYDHLTREQLLGVIVRLQDIIENMKGRLEDVGAPCEECGGELHADEQEYGLCTDCSRLLS